MFPNFEIFTLMKKTYTITSDSTGNNALLSDELTRLREGRTKKAVEKCTEWLSYCISIGWRKQDLDGLEKIWWEHRDKNGELIAV